MRYQFAAIAALFAGLVVPSGPAPVQRASRAWFGFGLSCSNCGWQMQGANGVFTFSEPPMVAAVEPGSPADRSGLIPGDRLVSIDNLPLVAPSGATRFSAVRPGERVLIEYERAKQSHRVDLVAGTWPTNPPALTPRDTSTAAAPSLPARFTGQFGGLDVEVRGSPAVTVSVAERDCWMEIVTKDARVRLRGDASSCNARRGR